MSNAITTTVFARHSDYVLAFNVYVHATAATEDEAAEAAYAAAAAFPEFAGEWSHSVGRSGRFGGAIVDGYTVTLSAHLPTAGC